MVLRCRGRKAGGSGLDRSAPRAAQQRRPQGQGPGLETRNDAMVSREQRTGADAASADSLSPRWRHQLRYAAHGRPLRHSLFPNQVPGLEAAAVEQLSEPIDRDRTRLLFARDSVVPFRLHLAQSKTTRVELRPADSPWEGFEQMAPYW